MEAWELVDCALRWTKTCIGGLQRARSHRKMNLTLSFRDGPPISGLPEIGAIKYAHRLLPICVVPAGNPLPQSGRITPTSGYGARGDASRSAQEPAPRNDDLRGNRRCPATY